MRRSIALASAVLLISFAVGRFGMTRFRSQSSLSDATLSSVLPAPGSQLLYVYIGSSRCGPSNSPELPRNVDSLGVLVRGLATQRGQTFASLGVARELSVAAGIKHLAKYQPFDEIDVGQRELNQSSLRYISRDHPGIAATPQLLVVERSIEASGIGVDAGRMSETVLVRKVGVLEIRRWLEQGAPLPRSGRDRSQPKSAQSAVPF